MQHCGKLPQVEWDLFFPEVSKLKVQAANVRCHAHGSDVFLATLAQCDGIVANAGHSLLAEAMYLGIPVLALPLKLYEQQLNALMVASHSFGMLVDQFDREKAHEFVARLEYFAGEIASDTSVLIRGDGVSTVLEELDCYLA